jgi:leucyl aminopeptidase
VFALSLLPPVVALGEHCAALFSNSDSLSQSLLDAGEATGERLWRMPMMKEHEEELKATYADFKSQ